MFGLFKKKETSFNNELEKVEEKSFFAKALEKTIPKHLKDHKLLGIKVRR
jgi:hypothetical protein